MKENNLNQNENIENQQKKDNKPKDLSHCLEDFTNSELKKLDNKKRNQLLNNLYKNQKNWKLWELNMEEFKEFFGDKFKAFLDENNLSEDEFNLDNISEIETSILSDFLTLEFWKDILAKENLKKLLYTNLHNNKVFWILHWVVNKKQIDLTIDRLLKEKSSAELILFTKNKSWIESFIKDILLPEFLPSYSKNLEKVINSIDKTIYEKYQIDYDNLNNDQKIIFSELVLYNDHNNKEVIALLKEWIIPEDKKMDFLNDYCPNFTLQEAIDLDLITTWEAEAYLAQKFEWTLSSNLPLSNDSFKKYIVNSVSNISWKDLDSIREELDLKNPRTEFSYLRDEVFTSLDKFVESLIKQIESKISKTSNSEKYYEKIISAFDSTHYWLPDKIEESRIKAQNKRIEKGEYNSKEINENFSKIKNIEEMSFLEKEEISRKILTNFSKNLTDSTYVTKLISVARWFSISPLDVINENWNEFWNNVKQKLLVRSLNHTDLSSIDLSEKNFSSLNNLYTPYKNNGLLNSVFNEYSITVEELNSLMIWENDNPWITDNVNLDKLERKEDFIETVQREINNNVSYSERIEAMNFEQLRLKLEKLNPHYWNIENFKPGEIFKIKSDNDLEFLFEIKEGVPNSWNIILKPLYCKKRDEDKFSAIPTDEKEINAETFLEEHFSLDPLFWEAEYISKEEIEGLLKTWNIPASSYATQFDLPDIELKEYDRESIDLIMNENDPDGSNYPLEEGLNFSIKVDGWAEVLTVTHIRNATEYYDWLIEVKSTAIDKNNSPVSYQMTFEQFKNSFIDKNAKRFGSNLNSPSKLNARLNSTELDNKNLNKLHFDEKWFKKKDLEGKTVEWKGDYMWVNFFKVTKNVNSKTGIKLKKWTSIEVAEVLPNGQIKVKYWEYKEVSNKTAFTKVSDNSNNVEFLTLSELFFLLNSSEDIIPYDSYSEIDSNPYSLNEKFKEEDQKFGLIWRYLNCYSSFEIANGIEIVFKWIWDNLKKESDYKAAKIANSIWRFLPWELQDQLTIKNEKEEKSLMDSVMDDLKMIDSNIASKRVLNRLKNSSTPEYKKEAWMIFMLKEYGHLYSKELANYQGTHLWYTAMWGKIWDKLYTEIKQKCERDGSAFSEEFLMFRMINMQCKWRLSPKRRSRLHKEFKALWWKGIEDDKKKGVDDGSQWQSFKERIWMVEWEIKWGTYANAWWAFESVIAKINDWSWANNMKNVNAYPFYMMATWASRKLDGDREWDKIKNIMCDWAPVSSLFFMSKVERTDVYMNAASEVSKRVNELHLQWVSPYSWEVYGRMKERFDKMYSDSLDLSIWDWETRCENVYWFWKDYWELLSRTLWMLSATDDKYALTDSLVSLNLEKNPAYSDLKSMSNASFANLLSWFHVNKERMDDWFHMWGTSWTYTKWAAKTLKLDTNGAFVYKGSKMIQEMNAHLFWDKSFDVVWIRDKIYVNQPWKTKLEMLNSKENRIAQKKLYLDFIIPTLAVIYKDNSSHIKDNFGKTELWGALKKWWIDLSNPIFLKQSTDTISSYKKDPELEAEINSIIDGWLTNSTTEEKTIYDVTENMKESLDKIFN